MSVTRILLALSLASSIAACGSSPPRAETADATDSRSAPAARDIAGAQPLEGPFASFDEVCGAPEGAPDDEGSQRHERCTVRVFALSDAGPFEAMATYFEGTAFDGDASVGLKTARGWFVQGIPDGQPVGGGLSHHTPASAELDPTTTRLEEGVLRVVQRGGSASFAPGMGNLGSTRRQWTQVQQCGLREGAVVCGAPEQVWEQVCRVSDRPIEPPSDEAGPFGRGETTCEEHGTDIQ
jgi:hypothetical protein